MRRTDLSTYALGALIACCAILIASSIACLCTGTRRSPTPTRALASRAAPTATRRPPPTATHTPTSPPKPTATPQPKPESTATTEKVKWVDPAPEELDDLVSDMSSGQQFQILFHEKYIEELALGYLDEEPELPVPVQDVEIIFEPDEITVSALISMGFLRVEALARGRWRAVNCRLDAQIVEVSIAGAEAPATLRQQVVSMLDDALKSLSKAPVCFTSAKVRDGELEINGYKK